MPDSARGKRKTGGSRGCRRFAPKMPQTACLLVALVAATVFFPASARAQAGSLSLDPPHVIVPTPDPFSLSAYDALHARAVMHRVGFVQLWYGSGAPRTVSVEEVETVRVGYEEGLPPGHRVRYDLRLNGQSVDWKHTYIEYGGRMVSLQLLFTYRNQHPPDDLQYTGNDYTW